MHCSCGGMMLDRRIQRDLKIVAEWKECIGCGRTYWHWAGPEIDRVEHPVAPAFVTEVGKKGGRKPPDGHGAPLPIKTT